MQNNEIASVCLQVVQVFEKLGVSYQIGGALASSLYGVFRATADIDIVADLDKAQIPSFLAGLKDQYYADLDAIQKAVGEKRSFNIIHLQTMLKVDIFSRKEEAFHTRSFSRSRQVPYFDNTDIKVWCASPEDTILHKLLWYRSGSKISERQWSDVIGVLRVQAEDLDYTYMTSWAEKIGVQDLLIEAINEVSG